METISCTCKECGGVIGECANLWTQIGRTYFSPIVEPHDGFVIASHGPVRLGERGTLVEACQLQDITCAQCDTVLGIKCLESPTNHVLDENQVLLRATSVSPVSSKGGRKIDFVVKRYLKLREPSRTETNEDRPHSRDAPGQGAQYGYHHSAAPELVDISQLQADLDVQRSDIDRIDKAGFKVVSSLDEAVSRVEGHLAKMRHTLSELQREIGGNHDDMSSLKLEIKDVKRQAQDSTAINKLEEQLHSANRAVEGARQNVRDSTAQFRQDLAGVKSEMRESREDIEELRALVRDSVSARDHAKEMASIRGELSQLRNQMDERRSEPPEQFPARELDILTSNIAKIGNRASQVENLQMEFEIFKGRVERMESARQGRPSLLNGAKEISPYDQYDDDKYHAGDTVATRRKRPSSGLDPPSILGSNSTKRTAFLSKSADNPNASEGTPSSAGSTIQCGGGLRLTKAGNVDRRAQRGLRRTAIGISSDGKATATRRRG